MIMASVAMWVRRRGLPLWRVPLAARFEVGGET